MPGATATQQPLEPIYVHSAVNAPIPLGLVDLEFEAGGQARHEQASAMLTFAPRSRVELTLSSAVRVPFVEGLWMKPGRGKMFQANLIQTEISSRSKVGRTVFVPKCGPVTPAASTSAIHWAVCHLFNLPDFSVPAVKRAEISADPNDRRLVILRADGWEITVARTSRTREAVHQLKDRGGYALTHIAKIAKQDGSTFTDGDLSDALSCLHWFLSFCFGRRVGVGLAVGFDRAGGRIWEQWGITLRARDACADRSFLDDQHGDLLAGAFPGFWRLWKDPQWQRPLTCAIDWYTRANAEQPGVETGIILGQVALELLAWTHCVQILRISQPKKAAPKASDRLRRLASALSIPLGILAHLKTAAPPGKPWADVAEALTKTRNNIVHPDVNASASSDGLYEIRALSLWMVEMVILRLCEYKGEYANRLHVPRWAGSVEAVPWAAGLAQSGKLAQ